MQIENHLRRVSWVLYPVIMAGAIGLYLLLETAQPDVFWHAWLPALVGAVLVALLEQNTPYQQDWFPTRSEVGVDLLYMLVVQVAFPLWLGIGMVSALQALLPLPNAGLSALWPGHWSIVAQGLLVLVLADFGSYWLHRLAHSNRWLWRLHEIHHSSEKLYWLNVGRFHPMEKMLQYTISALPFVLLGVERSVLGLYFVFYAVNGFFQHANINLRFGLLNYLISSSELHRWHHHPQPGVAAHNFGNNLIIWDVIFGTRYLPKQMHVERVGLIRNDDYPQHFIQQLRRPFRSRRGSDEATI